MKDALLLLSGGMDSGVLLAVSRPNYHHVICMGFDYGSKHSQRELAMAQRLASVYDASFVRIKLPFIDELFSSSLLRSGDDIPDGPYTDGSIASSVVPFRNGIMLSIGVGYAENNGIDTVLIASHAGDHPVYPDCSEAFTSAMSRAAGYGTFNHVSVSAPFSSIDKKDIAQKGRAAGFDFGLTWSCYKGLDIHCGTCATCLERKAALEYDKGLDPTRYMK